MSNGGLEESEKAARLATTRLEALRSWLVANDVHLSSKLAIRAVPSDADDESASKDGIINYGIYALQPISENEILSVTPRRAILSKNTCSIAEEPAFLDFCDKVTIATPVQAGVRILVTVLAHEIQLGNESKWYGYIQSMPQSYQELGLPMFWDDEEALLWLDGTDVLPYMQHQLCTKVRSLSASAHLCQDLLVSQAQVETFYKDLVVPLFNEQVSSIVEYATFKLAFSLVLSRAFYVDNYHGLSMVPLADIFNHHYEPHAILQSEDIVCPSCGSRTECEHDAAEAVEVIQPTTKPSQHRDLLQSTSRLSLQHVDDLDADAVEMIATTNIDKGEEVYNTYGKLDNAALLANYGFMLEANEDDKVRWFSVESVLDQAGLAGIKNERAIEDRWKTAVKSERWHQVIDARITEENISDAHLKAPHDLLYIDADGSISSYLWLLLTIAVEKHQQTEKQYNTSLDELCTATVERLLRSRLEQLHGHQQDISWLFERLEQVDNALHPSPVLAAIAPPSLQNSRGRERTLALSRVIHERLLLTACLERWQEGHDAEEDSNED